MKVPVQAHDACFSGISREIFHGDLLGFNLTENELVNKTGKFQGKGAFLVISQVGLGVVGYRASLRSLVLEESWTSCLKHGVSHEPFSLLIFLENIMVVLVSFRFSFDQFQHSRCGLLGWLKCPFLENFGHSFWAILLGNPFGHMGL